MFTAFVTSTPEKHKWVSRQELETIQSGRTQSGEVNKKQLPVPWKAIVKSSAIQSFIAYKLCVSFGLFVLQSKLPSYMSEILHMHPTKVQMCATTISRLMLR